MPSLRDETTRKGLIQRLQSLTPEAKPKWGKLDAPRVLCHLGDTLAISLGDLPVKSAKIKIFHHFPLKHLILYVLPVPREATTAFSELLSTAPRDFATDQRRVVELINRVAGAPDSRGPEHPLLGPLSNNEWNVLQWKHINHRLKQFDC